MKLILYIIFIFIPLVAFSQKKTAIYFNNATVSEVFLFIEKNYDVKISYADALINDKKITLDSKNVSLSEVLLIISEKSDLDFEFINQRYIVVNASVKEEKRLQQLSEVVITSYLTKGIFKNKDGSFTVKPKQLGLLPGLTEADVLESIQELPGVISPEETATGLIVRGGSPDGNQIIWDGINIYHNGHFFGMISAFNPNITQNVTFYNKGTNPRYGDRVSSVIDISTDNEVAKKINFGLGLNGISGDAYLNMPIIKDKLSVLFSYRKSYEGIIETGTFDKIEKKVFQSTRILDLGNSEEVFYFRDYNIKLNYVPNKYNSFSASIIHIDNDLEHNSYDINHERSIRDLLDTENNGYSLSWDKKWNDNISQYTRGSFSKYRLDYNDIQFEDDEQVSDFQKYNRIHDSDLLSELSIKTKSNNRINLGFQTSIKNVSYSFTEVTDLFYVLDQKTATINTNSVFANYLIRNFKPFDLDLGLRTNYYSQLNSIRFEPRVLVIKNLNNYLKLQVTGEVKNQIISQIEESVLSDLTLENKIWRLADGGASPIINSVQFSAGLLYHKNGWSFDLDSYYKYLKGISSLSLGFLNDNGYMFYGGRQKVIGSDFYLKKDFNFISTWISYSLIKIDDQFDGINNNNYFTSSNEIRQTVSISTAYKSKKFQIALGWKWHTGKPFTLSSINPSDNSVVFDGVNTGNLPDYHRLDLSALYNLTFSKPSNINGKIGFSIRNLYNQKNYLSKEYLGNNIPNDPIVIVDKYSLSLIPNFLFRLNF